MDKASNQILEDLKRSWASKVISALLMDFQSGKNALPPNVILRGVNMVEKDNGTFTVGFVFAKEG